MADILSQEEIDALLQVVDEDGDTAAATEVNLHPEEPKQVIIYDFKRPNRVSKEQLRAVKGIHDKLARNLASQISSIMRSIVEIRLHSVDQMTYGEFLMSLPSPTSFNVFSIKPLDGNCVLEINPSIAFPMIDRLLGGNGDGFESNRELTDIEINLLDAILRIMMQRLKESWSMITDMYPNVEAKESSPNVVQIVSQNEIVIMVVMEIIIGNSSGMINLCYPVIYLEPILSRLANRDIMLGETSAKKSRNKELKTLIGRAEVLYEAILGKTVISVNEFLNLKEGDILRLDRSADDKAIVCIDKKDVFLAQIGLHRFRKSIKIEELIKTDKDEIKSILEQYEEERKAKIMAYQEQTEEEPEEEEYDE
ncbi:flagellar motor switch protein FliM [Campylobacter hyointestinalis]|uniref:Flagellar motor switch protein FliM n=1 Tax=Campylobacter hyointestinalis subsp. hyointestinalis TaxID=91352 RepID=A0A855N3W2_CAMHY|nr:flagellar motor switch protein FliM [Campylobacter hyointestinalis]ANE33158.1 flagellar motor switch protein [Campylobacter hyointestinalis subsp. hyointestinalis LMG 9260]KEA44772.1 flagellar motor switch protein FliM [Campylobacter hyointestinalis subsp. hyointestinalis]MBT0611255.1 flagellar motor switch protein FliM [Campylobacter hyointestinalis subsp. hyointestinalis]MDL2346383.1 flagellar motor switch protein FliM [Campylobacter hyointestinalis]MDL2348123.1 flagellar motor switch pro